MHANFFAIAAFVSAAVAVAMPQGNAQCNVGQVQCCNSVQPASDSFDRGAESRPFTVKVSWETMTLRTSSTTRPAKLALTAPLSVLLVFLMGTIGELSLVINGYAYCFPP